MYNVVMLRDSVVAFVAMILAGQAVAQVTLPPTLGVPPAAETVPTPAHDLALRALAAGDYAAASDLALKNYQAGVRVGADRWIDTIASAALLGECFYELGRLGDAVARYDESLLAFATHGDWLLSLQFHHPVRAGGPRIASWGRSERNTRPGAVPEVVPIRQRGADPQQVLQRGGVLAAEYDRPVRPQELMRLLVIALYRQRVLLGELAAESSSLDAATKALLRRPAPPNHWSQSWIDIALGTAHWSQGKHDLAAPLLKRGLTMGDGFDHGLTAWGLVVLGRIALDADNPQQAAKLFEEATYAAADAGDARALEEAFSLAAGAYAMAGARGVPASIGGGADWARAKAPLLAARLRAIEAERFVAAGDPRSARSALRDIDGRLLRGEAGRGRLGGEAAYAEALIDYASGDVAQGDGRLAEALTIARAWTPRLFQTARLVDIVSGGATSVSDREADALLQRLLADPSPRDFAADPLGSLATLSAPRTEAFDLWVAVAARRGNEAAVEAAEATMRHRWIASQPLGGRRIAVERLIAAEPGSLTADAAARRAAMLGGRPELAAAVERLGQLRGTFAAALAAGPGAVAEHPDWASAIELAVRRGQFVAEIAAGREAVPLDFPPLTSATEIRRRLRPRQLVLSFHWTASGLFGLLESRDRSAIWQVRQAAGLPAEIKALAKGLCLFDPVAPVPTARLAEGDWRGSAERIERILFENAKISLAEGIDELVIVPDGWLWYVPFELLPVASSRPAADEAGTATTLRTACRIRYAPTRSLAVWAGDRPGPGPAGVHVGRMARSDKAADTEAEAAQFAAIDRVVVLRPDGPVPIPMAATACDSLVIFDELAGDGPVRSWPLVPLGAGKGAMTLEQWLAPPLKRPQRVILPGLQTAMAGGLERTPSRPGEDVFLVATDLLAAGARTVVMSRWRTGGKACTDLTTEFLRESVAADAAEPSAAWQRAVDLVHAELPDAAREPRVKLSPDVPLEAPLHPFLWAGYLLIDTGSGRFDPPPAAAPAQPPAAAPPQARP